VKVRKLSQKRGWAWSLAVPILKPPLLAIVSRTWIDGDKIPASGGCLVVFNHISHADPLLAAHFVYDHGRLPRYLAKAELFSNKILGGFLKAAGQIPVERLSKNASGAYDAALAAIKAGECVVLYPEGTLTRDPELWPMMGKSGAARIALDTGCPVIPVGQWGAQALLAPYALKPNVFPRKNISMKAGDPIALDDLLGREQTPELVAEATERIMKAITQLVEQVRGGTAPSVRFDPRTAGIAPIGNPKKAKKERGS
jgi:1-acyl-sn-glycerol-3-phosphate acyltransferase